jgi:hypothetical protein
MQRVSRHNSMEDAGSVLLVTAIDPRRWATHLRRVNIENICRVGNVQVCASVDVTPTLETYLRVSFKGPRLSPLQAAELLERFTSARYTFIPNIEWFVEIDSREWIHFSRRYSQPRLEA